MSLYIGTAIIAIILVLIGGESTLRLIQLTRYSVPVFGDLEQARLTYRSRHPETFRMPPGKRLHERFGWVTVSHFSAKRTATNIDRSTYETDVKFTQRGFRQFGTLQTKRPKILVIGDSFTEANWVSNDKTYYSVLGRELDVEVFAIGVGGFGTLQEYMLLDTHIDDISPDLIIWQYSSNDLNNNNPRLEALTRSRIGITRPYLIDGNIQYQLATPSMHVMRSLGLGRLRLAVFLASRLEKYGLFKDSTPSTAFLDETRPGGSLYDEFLSAIQTTELIMQRTARRVNRIPVVTFLADGVVHSGNERDLRYGNIFEEIATSAGFLYADTISPAFESALLKGSILFIHDGGHWNEAGNKLAGESIAKYVRSHFSTNLQ